MFENKVIMITGGTGSFGNSVLERFLSTEVKEVRIFSRDEKKQEDMKVVDVVQMKRNNADDDDNERKEQETTKIILKK